MESGLRRIIPARAGFTATASTSPPPPRDHPRSRGVYVAFVIETEPGRGSSPLARGLRVPHHGGDEASRIIPARAGFTQQSRRRLGSDTDHPRSRGVYLDADGHTDETRGSSPLARGLRAPVRRLRPRRGIIPARAGFTHWGAPSTGALTDHPRSRGVYRCAVQRTNRPSGSSPLARGLPRARDWSDVCAGIIPARAGFTVGPRDHWRAVPDHPRSRGVYIPGRPVLPTARGSSPLARGLRQVVAVSILRGGIIPARAGFTTARRKSPNRSGDHPRSRGVYKNLWTLA